MKKRGSAVTSPPILIFTLARLGGVYRSLLSLETALQVHREALEISETPGLRWWFAEMVAAELCADYCMAGDWSTAYPYARRALSARGRYAAFVALLFPYAIEALVRNGDTGAASDHLQHFSEQANANPRLLLAEHRARASIARGRGEWNDAILALENAATIATELGLQGEEWQIRAEQAQLYASQGKHELADETNRQRHKIARTLVGKITDAELRRKLRRNSNAVNLKQRFPGILMHCVNGKRHLPYGA